MKLNYVISMVLPGMVSVFKKLFGRKEAPTNTGKTASSGKVSDVRWVKKFVLELTNMEGSPSYGLTHQLTIGSEVGNIVIADPSVSPRHCTFILQEEVVSVTDHGSISGTFINGQKIPPGRFIILEETDTIKVGDLEVQVNAVNEALPEEVAPQAEVEDTQETVDDDQQDEVLDEELDEEAEQPANSKFAFFKKFMPSKNPKATPASVKKNSVKKTPVINSSYATNSLVRLFAVICDLLIAYILYVLFSPFDEFRTFVSDVPVMLGDILGVEWNSLLAVVNEDYAFVGEMLKDLYNFFSVTFHFGPLFLLFVMVRLISTLLFGVSISEAVLGVRSRGNSIWARVGGFIRVVLGIFTGPFLIFDTPAIVSRRTFKEFMTFTHTYLSSKFIAILGVLLYLPSLVAISLFSPLLQGLELPEPIVINEKLDTRVKVQPVAGQETALKTSEFSRYLNLELKYDSQNLSVIPMFKFSGQKKKINYRPSFVFYHRDLQRSVQFELLKTFDLKELLSIGMKGDYFLQEKFPELNEFVNPSGALGDVFRKNNNEKSNRKFADEAVFFTKLAFGISIDNAIDNMQEFTPFLKGLMDYRSSFLSLLEYKGLDQIDFIKLGNAYFLRVSYNMQKPFDLIIPLIKGEGRIYRVEFDKKENLGVLRNKFYKYTMDDSNWLDGKASAPTQDTLNPMQVMDFFANLNMKAEKMPVDKAQALYGYYFEKSADVIRKDDATESELWKKSVDTVFTIMEKMKDAIPEPAPVVAAPEVAPTTTEPVLDTAPVAEGAEVAPTPGPVPTPDIQDDPRMKLFQNFQDLKNAVDNKNKEFFGISESTSI